MAVILYILLFLVLDSWHWSEQNVYTSDRHLCLCLGKCLPHHVILGVLPPCLYGTCNVIFNQTTLDIFIFGVPLFLARSGKFSSQSILSELQVPNDVTHYVTVKNDHPPPSLSKFLFHCRDWESVHYFMFTFLKVDKVYRWVSSVANQERCCFLLWK